MGGRRRIGLRWLRPFVRDSVRGEESAVRAERAGGGAQLSLTYSAVRAALFAVRVLPRRLDSAREQGKWRECRQSR